MHVSDLIEMIRKLPDDDQAHIRAALNADAVGLDGLPVLDLPMDDNDANAATIRGYFKAQLRALWTEQECFNGKRPFGSSGWDYDLDRALIRGGRVAGTIDDDDDYEGENREEINRVIMDAINAL